MKSPISLTTIIALFAPIALVVVVVEAGGHTTPGGTILDIGDCRSRFCPRDNLGADPTSNTTLIPPPRPLRTVQELFRFGGGRNYDDDGDWE